MSEAVGYDYVVRIAAASAMPSIVSGNTNATVHGVAQRVAEIITHPGRW
ncbi:hypothetical protein ACFYSJ_28820 [Streptomyces sp. NPDC005248]